NSVTRRKCVARLFEHAVARVDDNPGASPEGLFVDLALIPTRRPDRVYVHPGPQPAAEQNRRFGFHGCHHHIGPGYRLLRTPHWDDFHSAVPTEIRCKFLSIGLRGTEHPCAAYETRSMHGRELGTRFHTRPEKRHGGRPFACEPASRNGTRCAGA